MPFKIIRNDITKVDADAIVNTANPKPKFGRGSDGAIYLAAGEKELLEARRAIGEIKVGQVAVTPAFNLKAKYIIHTVGPEWRNNQDNEFEKLQACYINSLEMARELKCKSIALPLISTGVYGMPKDKGLKVAISAISDFLLYNEMNVILVVFDQTSFELSGKLFLDVDEFIDENYVSNTKISEYRNLNESDDERETSRRHRENPIIHSSLDEFVTNAEDTFQERLFSLIDKKELTDAEVYKNANIDRKLFSKIRCNVDYKPKKKTVVALAIALRLNLEETIDLLRRAEMALSPSNKFDLIIQYYISNKEYDMYTINIALFKHNQQLLGE